MTVTRAPGTSLFEGGAIGEVSDGEDESSELSSSGGNTKFPWLFDGELVEVARACLYIFRILLQDGSEGLAADLREINNFFEEFVDRVRVSLFSFASYQLGVYVYVCCVGGDVCVYARTYLYVCCDGMNICMYVCCDGMYVCMYVVMV